MGYPMLLQTELLEAGYGQLSNTQTCRRCRRWRRSQALQRLGRNAFASRPVPRHFMLGHQGLRVLSSESKFVLSVSELSSTQLPTELSLEFIYLDSQDSLWTRITTGI
jgi:hypothetical protein